MAVVIPAQQANYAARLEQELIKDSMPHHIGVIMDGNGRWGVGHGMTREYGHRESVDAMRTVVTAASDLGIDCLSLYCFSTENIERPKEEVASLFKLFNDVLDEEPERLNEKNVRIITSGMVGLLPDPLPGKFARAIELTAANTGLILNLCVMYSGRHEIVEAAKRMALAAQQDDLDIARMDEGDFAKHLFHPMLPEVDLTIRTSGEQRISNFLLWQMAYSELVFSDVLWPDFSRADFFAALLEFQHRSRRFGKV